jgi:hypothetical protein
MTAQAALYNNDSDNNGNDEGYTKDHVLASILSGNLNQHQKIINSTDRLAGHRPE